MLAKRIIPCLDVRGGRTVKGTKFESLRDMGDPVELAKYYSDGGADELVFLDIAASAENLVTLYDMVERVARTLSIPFTVGGGVRSLRDADEILRRGADKVSVNSSALNDPTLISEIAEKYGSQCVVVAVDYKRVNGEMWVFSHGGTRETPYKLSEWVSRATACGGGEILLTAIESDGTRQGFDCETIREMNRIVGVPIIASGGAGSPMHFVSVFEDGGADAALAAGILHSGEVTIGDIKKTLSENEILVRM